MSVLSPLLRVRRDRALSVAFRTLLLGEDGKPTLAATAVLAHLRAFCFADVSTLRYGKDGKVDALASAAAAGRQEVWLQFYFYLNVDPSELVEIDRKFQRDLRDSIAQNELMA